MKFISVRQRRARRRRLVRGAVGSLALAATVAGGGVLLPVEHVTSGTAVFNRSPETVWRVLTDLDGMPLWRSDLTTVERLPDHGGKTVWLEIRPNGSQVVELSREEPPFRLVMQGAEAGRASYPVRTFELATTEWGTRVTITERAEVPNPFLRVLIRLDPGHSAVRRLLRDLDQRLSVYRRQVAAEGIQ